MLPEGLKRSRSLAALQICTARGAKNRIMLLSITMQMHSGVIPPDPEARREEEEEEKSQGPEAKTEQE